MGGVEGGGEEEGGGGGECYIAWRRSDGKRLLCVVILYDEVRLSD